MKSASSSSSPSFTAPATLKTQQKTKVGFASEIIEFHPDIVNFATIEEFKAFVQSKFQFGEAIEVYPDIVIDPVTKEVTSSPLQDFGFKYTRFGRQANTPRFFAILRDPFDGEVFQVYTSWQRWDTKKGKYGKPYLFAPKSAPIYTNAIGGSKWHVVSEGKAKADFVAANGVTATSLTGAFGAYRIKDANGTPCAPYLAPEFKARLEAVGCKRIVLWMDSDANPKTQMTVGKAVSTTAALLEAEGYKVRIAFHDEAEGKGVDDAGLAQPEEQRRNWVDAHLKQAVTLKEWQGDRRRLSFVRYLSRVSGNQVTPERETLGGYLPPLPAMEPGTIVLVDAGTGCGKTTEAKRIVSAKTEGYTVVFAPTRSVGRAIAQALAIPHLNDCDKSDNAATAIFWNRVHNRRAIVLCIDSIDAIADVQQLVNEADLIVIDEVNQCLENIATGGTTKGEQARVLESFASFISGVIAKGGNILAAEAGITQHTIELLKKLSDCNAVKLFKHDRGGEFSPSTTIHEGSLSGFVAALAAAIVGSPETAGKRIFLPVSSQASGERIHRYLQDRLDRLGVKKKIVRVDSKTNDFGIYAELFGDSNRYLAESDIDLLIATPSIPSGVSFDAEYNYFDEVWGIFVSGHPGMWNQMQARVRADVPRHLFVKGFVQTTDTLERFTSERGVEQFLSSNIKGYSKAFAIDLESTADRDDLARRIEISDAIAQFSAVHYTSMGCQKAIAKDWFMRVLEKAGHQLSETQDAKVPKIQERLNEIKEEIEREEAAIIADLEADTSVRGFGDGIAAARLRSPEMQEKYYQVKVGGKDGKLHCPVWIRSLLPMKNRCIEQAPGIDFDNAEICYAHLCQDNGRQYRGALLQALSENVESVKILDKKEVEGILKGRIQLSHRLPKRLMRAKLIEICGISKLLNGESYHNGDERAIAIKAVALKWDKEIWKWLGLSIKDTQTPVEICNKLLLKLGLEAVAIARPGAAKGEKRDRIYNVPGVNDPFRSQLLNAMRSRLREVVETEASIVDALKMLREAEGDRILLRAIWEALQGLPELQKEAIWERLEEHERYAIEIET